MTNDLALYIKIRACHGGMEKKCQKIMKNLISIIQALFLP